MLIDINGEKEKEKYDINMKINVSLESASKFVSPSELAAICSAGVKYTQINTQMETLVWKLSIL